MSKNIFDSWLASRRLDGHHYAHFIKTFIINFLLTLIGITGYKAFTMYKELFQIIFYLYNLTFILTWHIAIWRKGEIDEKFVLAVASIIFFLLFFFSIPYAFNNGKTIAYMVVFIQLFSGITCFCYSIILKIQRKRKIIRRS